MKPYTLKKFAEKIRSQEKCFENTFKISEKVIKMKKQSPWYPQSSKKPSETEDEKNPRDLETLFRPINSSGTCIQWNKPTSKSFNCIPSHFLVVVTRKFNNNIIKFYNLTKL